MKTCFPQRKIYRNSFEDISPELYVLSLSRFCEDLGSGMLVALIPLYIADLGSSFFTGLPLVAKAGLVTAVFGLFSAITQPLIGRFSDKIDRRRPFILFGLVGYTFFSFLYSHVTGYEQLLFIRLLQGITVGATIPAVIAMVTHISSPENRGRAVGIYTTIRGVGFGLGPIVGGAIASYYGFEAGFHFCAFLGIVSLVLVNLFVKETRGPGEPVLEESSGNGLVSIYSLAGAMLMMMVGIMMIVALLPEYEVRLEASELSLGVAVSAYIFARLLFQTPLGSLSDRIGRKKLIVSGLFLSIPLVVVMGYVTSVNQLIFARALQGVLVASIDTPAMALAADLSNGSFTSSKLSIITTAQAAGMAIGPIFGGFLAGYMTFVTPFYACALLMLLAGFVVMKKVEEPERS
ncbi:bicyclomycin/multidrug efflux system [Methanosarcina sp. MTP4]|uniref:MFS transporter n=1 Tax=Methanosarcina sp. MTP4 TaxID=1434100 RepID=UPI000615F583|nr:MFS transporter [Methanosarcina sp. MTP4]AKB25864.1 bicyclomycin/multidrug efflux system [Methanosarcina sp. MTP4]